MGGLARLLVLLIMTVPVAPPSSAAPTLQLIPNSVHPGERVTVNGSGFDSCFPGPPPIPSPTPTPRPTPPVLKIDGEPSPAGTPAKPPPVTVTVHWVKQDGSNGSLLATTQLDASSGGFATSFTVPSTLRPGSHDVSAECGDPNGGTGVPGEIAYATLTVTAIPVPPSPRPASPEPSNRPSPTSPVVTPSQSALPTSSPDSSFPPGEQTPPPRPPEPSLPGWLVVVGIVAGLVALSALGRSLLRTYWQPQQSPRLPVVQAVLRTDASGPVELRRTVPGQSAAIRVVLREDTRAQVVLRIGGVGQE